MANSETILGQEQAQDLLTDMTAEERVGQLFLVSFTGTNTDSNSQIYDLIMNHHIGGVVLLAGNDNFLEGPGSLSYAYDLVAQLQTIEWQSSQRPTVDPNTGGPAALSYIPLMVGISQPASSGNGDLGISGLTSIPNQMAIGATWDVSLAEQVGHVVGEELSTLGFNLFIGPSLDVLEFPDATLENGLGASVFGGDPYWVGQMGQAYIRGLHAGSDNKMLVIARNFPGRGSTDRPAGEEPATVRKTLDSLKQIDLAPFFSVTGAAPDEGSTTDGLLVSHIRYQGFQGNIRSTTRPVSFDSQALTQILSLPEFTGWRTAGGLTVSEDLGSDTVRRFYDPGGTTFNARQVVRDAFLAGNDLLYLGNIRSSDSPENYETVVNILNFFVQKFREDAAFAQLVNDAVTRILAAKTRISGEFELNNVIPAAGNVFNVGNSSAVTFQVASQAATLVSPNLTDLDAVLPESPALSDNIVFITDARAVSQCTICTESSLIGVQDMQNATLRLYGPNADGLVNQSRLASYSLESLASILDNAAGDSTLERNIYQADWLVINMLDAAPDQTQTLVLRRFLSERQDLLRNKNVLVFAFNAPFYLDSTDISKLTAYYCLYSHSSPFIDVAVRLLFREMTPNGALPVSVSGAGYDLFSALTPDPSQVITLQVEIPSPAITTETSTPQAVPTVAFRVGDSVSVRTGVIMDHNGNPVPDGTGVQFTLTQSGVSGVMQQVEAFTSQGVARASFNIDRSGLLEVRATSDPATISFTLQMDVSGESFSVTVVAPTPESTFTPTPESAATPGTKNTSTPVPLPNFGGWLLMVVLLAGLTWLAFLLGGKVASMLWGLRWGLCTTLGGLLGYSYLAARLPGMTNFIQQTGYLGVGGIVLAGAIVGLAAGYVWMRIKR